MKDGYDIVILGSGFAGSLMSMIAARLGRSVLMIERGRHPRFAIGESSTPLANLLLEELATRYALPRLLPLAKWGSWQRTYPQLGCGLKRGFTFYQHRPGLPFGRAPDRSDQLLVAASPADHIADTHWYRADVDQFLMEEALALGVDYLDETSVESVECDADGNLLQCVRGRERVEFRARWVIDASGSHGALARHLRLSRASFAEMPSTQTLFSHFTGVKDAAVMTGDGATGDSGPTPPYPVDFAGVHHVLPGGWVWSLRFNNGVTSAGLMATPEMAVELRLGEGAAAWGRLLDRFPSLGAIFGEARATRPFVHAAGVPFRVSPVTSGAWTLLPSAAGFVDPLLSTGFPLTLLGIERLAGIVEKDWGSDGWSAALEAYAGQTHAELDVTAMLVGALYRCMGDFGKFVPLTLLYFAAASFSEASRRLGRAGYGFLLHDHPTFGPAMRRCCGIARKASAAALAEEVRRAIEPIDIAGLSRSDRRNWYPADAADTLAACGKLGVDEAAVRGMLERCGLCVG